MSSFLAWVDYSEKDRERMMDVTRLFQQPEARDELGLGSVRDAFADHFFPGTSTIQTRAKYMLYVPWIYQYLEQKQTSLTEIESELRRFEINLIEPLLRGEDTDGIIGKVARERLQRLPSSIYWSGLGVWGIRKFIGSQSEYHNSLNSFYKRKKIAMAKKKSRFLEDDKDSPNFMIRDNWCNLPSPLKGFPQNVEGINIKLLKEEAFFLKERIMSSCKGSLLAHLIDMTNTDDGDVHIWAHPDSNCFPRDIKHVLRHARNFSEIIHGAALMYNLMLSELRNMPEWVIDYEEMIEHWAEGIESRRSDFNTWNTNEFWDMLQKVLEDNRKRIPYVSNVSNDAKNFINSWIKMALDSPGTISKRSEPRQLVRLREEHLKKSAKSRFLNDKARNEWMGMSGTGQLDYRWASVRVVVNDILSGLGKV